MSRRVCVASPYCSAGCRLLCGRFPRRPPRRVPPASAVASSTTDSRAVLDRYCVTCHNERAKIAGLTLDKVDLSDIPANADVLEKVVRKVRVGMMPPQGAPRPDQATAAALVAHLTTRARSRRAREAESGARTDSPPESRRVRERHPRSVLARDRRVGDAAARRRGVRVRQHRGRARRLARAARALSDGGGQDHLAGGRRSGNPDGGTDLPHSPGCVAGHAHRRAADRHRRRDPGQDDAAARRRVHVLGSGCSAPTSASSAGSNTTISSSSRSTASACTCRRSAATTISRPTSRT